LSGHTPWSEIKHKFSEHQKLRLSASAPIAFLDMEYWQLVRLKTHFSLLSRDIEEVDLVEVKYYRKTTKTMDIIAWTMLLVFGLYFTYKMYGVVT
jgi:hypothetical protein